MQLPPTGAYKRMLYTHKYTQVCGEGVTITPKVGEDHACVSEFCGEGIRITPRVAEHYSRVSECD